jgi:hypothetical protein
MRGTKINITPKDTTPKTYQACDIKNYEWFVLDDCENEDAEGDFLYCRLPNGATGEKPFSISRNNVPVIELHTDHTKLGWLLETTQVKAVTKLEIGYNIV